MISNIVKDRNYIIKEDRLQSKIYHKTLLKLGKAFFYGYMTSPNNSFPSSIIYAYECDLNEEDIKKVQAIVEELLCKDNIIEYKNIWSSNREIQRPYECGYTDEFISRCNGIPHFSSINEYIINQQNLITSVLNKDNVLLNALKVWVKEQPNGFNIYYHLDGLATQKEYRETRISRYEMENVNTTLSFLKRLSILLIAQESEIRALYQEYIDKTISFYNSQQDMDR